LAYHFDEGYHLLTAQLMIAGKEPYLDFCFPQTPLNAYWNAFWMRIFGPTWRVPHAVATLLTVGTVLLTADFVARRFPVPSWRTAGALTAGSLVALNTLVFQYTPLGQPYAICLFALTAAFRITVLAVGRSGILLPAAAGLCAGVAAGSSLLSAAAAPVLLAWMLFYRRAGARWPKFIAFGIGVLVPFAPVFRLFSLGPRATWFNLVQYHASFRKFYWPETTRHDLEVLTSWINSTQGLLIGLLAVFGLIYVIRQTGWPRPLKAEFYLCAWLAAGLSAEIGRAHPTFTQYFLLIVPFLAVLVVGGLYAIGSRVFEPDRPLWPVLLFNTLLVLVLARTLYDNREDHSWSTFQLVANKLAQVTPPDSLMFANEPIYVLLRRVPPPGFELAYSHKVNLPPTERSLLHVLTEDEVKHQVQSGRFATAYSCDDDEIADYGLSKLYNQQAEIGDCKVFWDLKPSQGTPAQPPPPKGIGSVSN
jgi:hypothetical protein